MPRKFRLGDRVFLDRDDCYGLRGTVTAFMRGGLVEVDFDEKVFYGRLRLGEDEVAHLSAVERLAELSE